MFHGSQRDRSEASPSGYRFSPIFNFCGFDLDLNIRACVIRVLDFAFSHLGFLCFFSFEILPLFCDEVGWGTLNNCVCHDGVSLLRYFCLAKKGFFFSISPFCFSGALCSLTCRKLSFWTKF